jgi:hypothetical protein
MEKPDLFLNDREILPISGSKFGVMLTQEEAHDLLAQDYRVKLLPQQDRAETEYYLEVNVGAHQRGSFDLAMLEAAGRGDIVISPLSWAVGRRSRTKAYLKSMKVADSDPS